MCIFTKMLVNTNVDINHQRAIAWETRCNIVRNLIENFHKLFSLVKFLETCMYTNECVMY